MTIFGSLLFSGQTGGWDMPTIYDYYNLSQAFLKAQAEVSSQEKYHNMGIIGSKAALEMLKKPIPDEFADGGGI